MNTAARKIVPLILALCAVAPCTMKPPVAFAAGEGRPNFVFVLTDDQRWESLGLTGNPVVRTPHIDRLAAEGTFFPNGTVNSAICTPSRVCYFLGQYERRHGVNFNSGTAVSAEAWEGSYPVMLRNAGYFTGYIGKNHTPVGPEGYESGIIEKSFDFWYAGHGALGFYPKARHAIFRGAAADTQVEILGEGVMHFLDPGAGFAAGAQAFLERRPTDRPFCLTLAFNVPHAAGAGTMELRASDPEIYRTTFRDRIATQPIPATYVAKADIRTPRLPADLLFTQFRQRSYDYVDTEATLRERQIREYQTIAGVDRLVGAIRTQLETLGLADNTVILFASDHGITHGEFGLGGKALNYDTCLRVPMIVMDPRVDRAARGLQSPALVQSIDFAPTILDLAGIPVPVRMQGQSFRPALEGRAFPGRPEAFSENLWSTYFGNPRCESVRTAGWKYIRYFANDRTLFAGVSNEAGGARISDAIAGAYRRWLDASVLGEEPVHEELYHLAGDPDETTNLAGDPRHQDLLDEMRTRCQQLVTSARGNPAEPPATVRIIQNPAAGAKAGKKN